ncbi:TRAP transporter small permease subunit [Microbaculum marinum]|uniref:TRAP transporter small permease protein n=1 Tax=Microbaculum marinum TaxID=1764581 RepID=A0AAW9RJS0_9HYPH
MAYLARLGRALDRLYMAAGYLAAAFLVALGCLVLASIVTRLMSVYVAGLTAYSGYCMAASSFLAMAYTLRQGEHIRVGMLIAQLKGRARRIAVLWCLAAASGIGVWFSWYLVRMSWISYRFEERSESADATLLWIPQTAVSVGATILAIAFVHSLAEAAFLGKSGIQEPEEQGAETAAIEEAIG